MLTKDHSLRVHVVPQPEGAAGSRGGSAPSRPGFVNLNTASASALTRFPAIGPKTAEKIMAARPLKSLADLDKVPGIGPKTIEALKDMVTF